MIKPTRKVDVGITCVMTAVFAFFVPPVSGQLDDSLVKQVEKIFVSRCFECHSGETAESGFRLDIAREKIFAGGDSEDSAIVPGDTESSSLLRWITAKDESERMPPDGDRLSDEQVNTIRKWIAQGAKMNKNFAKSTSVLWSFQPIAKKFPTLSQTSGKSINRIDDFISQKLIDENLVLSRLESKKTLIRRLYLVALGIPPSPEEVEAFVADKSPFAYENIVDRVMASSAFGERWAQHWLDIIRFGETHGFETNRERPNAWHYRDYVIESLNSDRPYDQFVREQIAGDQLNAPVATGFIVAGPHDIVKSPDINLTLMQRQDELADIVNVTGTTFMGLTVGCARCHDHKFDPISQKDFYSIQAIFAGVQHADRSLPVGPNSANAIVDLENQIALLKKKLKPFASESQKLVRASVNPKHNVELITPVKAKFIRFTIKKSNQAQPCIDEMQVFSDGKNVALSSNGTIARSNGDFVHPLHKLEHINDGQFGNSKSWIAKNNSGWVELEFPKAVKINRVEWGRDRNGQFSDRVAIEYQIEVALERGKWREVASSKDRLPFNPKAKNLPRYDFSSFSPKIADQGKKWLAELTRLENRRTDLSKPVQVYAGTFAKPATTYRLYRGDPFQKREAVKPNTIEAMGDLALGLEEVESKRRMRFANWLTHPDNPLLARVMVNRLWQHTFGRGIVATPNDFGNSGNPPSHPRLLDWLARELIRSKWSVKHVQRQIFLSHTFRQSSQSTSKGQSVDASCRLLWRFPPRRLEAESIRDSILFVTGALDRKIGGPGFSGFEVSLENVRHFFPKKDFGPSDWRRMIYMTKVRQERDAIFGAFDCPDASQIIARRSRSTTPLQSLNLLNSQFVIQQAALLAKRLETDSRNSGASPVTIAYQKLFAREATGIEIKEGEAFINSFGLPAFCRALLNANEFIFVQ